MPVCWVLKVKLAVPLVPVVAVPVVTVAPAQVPVWTLRVTLAPLIGDAPVAVQVKGTR